MADDDLEDQVTCWVCFEVMEDPTTLHCSHSFCKDCLVKVYKKDPNCPFCRRPFGLPLPPTDPDLQELVDRIRGGKSKPIPNTEPRLEIEQDSDLLRLPVEVASHILDFLEPQALLNVSSVCQELNSIVEDPWVWRTICLERFPFVESSDSHDWKRIFVRRNKLQKGWEGGKSGDFTVTSMRGHDGYINCIDLLKNQAVTGGSDGTIKVWRTNTSKMSYQCTGHTSLITSVKFNDIFIISSSTDRTVKIWDTQTGVLLRSIDDIPGFVDSVQFNQDNIISTSAMSGVFIHDIRSARLLHRIPSTNPTSAILLDNAMCAISSANGVQVFNLANPDVPVHTLNRVCSHIAVAGNSQLACFGAGDAILWNYETGAVVWTCPTGVSSPNSFKADSTRILVGGSDGKLAILKHRNPAVKTVQAHQGGVNDLQFDAQRVVTAGADNSIKVWDIKTGSPLYTLLGGSLQLRGAAKAHPSRPGCSNLVYDENRIVGSFANVLKSFNFGMD